MEQNGIPGIQGIDTRALTKKLRVRGALNGFISARASRTPKRCARARNWPGLAGVDYVKEVTHKEAVSVGRERRAERAVSAGARPAQLPSGNARDPLPPADIPIVAFDYGMKYNILRRLRQHGFRVQVVPATTTAAEALALQAGRHFSFQRPGRPVGPGLRRAGGARFGADTASRFSGSAWATRFWARPSAGRPSSSSSAIAAPTSRSRTWNPGRVEITSQNHGFAVDPATLPAEVVVDRINLNDQTVEGMRHRTKPVFCVQYHPEASPGPHDSTACLPGSAR